MTRIAARLGQSHTTVAGEVVTHSLHRYAVPFDRPEISYKAFWEHRSAMTQPPQQVAARLPVQFPDALEIWVSHQTIYQAIHLWARGNLRAELTPQAAPLRPGGPPAESPVAEAVHSNRSWLGLNISARPAEAADWAVPGHWKTDLVISKDCGSAWATLVESATRFMMLVGLPEGSVSEHLIGQLSLGVGHPPS